MNYGRAFKLLRERQSLSQKQLAERIERSPSYISKIESQDRDPSMELLEEVSRIFRVPIYVITLLATERSDVKNGAIYEQVRTTTTQIMDILDEAHGSENSIDKRS
jgi:transcriptional regulator with XRE-family HTH domain